MFSSDLGSCFSEGKIAALLKDVEEIMARRQRRGEGIANSLIVTVSTERDIAVAIFWDSQSRRDDGVFVSDHSNELKVIW